MRQRRFVSFLPNVRYVETVIFAFAKVGVTPRPFSLEYQGIRLKGTLHRKASHRLELDATLHGNISLDCDRCGHSYRQEVNEHMTLQISDEAVQDKDNLDIIEFLDGRVDLLFLLKSEVHALKGDYHFCPQCETEDEILELEF